VLVTERERERERECVCVCDTLLTTCHGCDLYTAGMKELGATDPLLLEQLFCASDIDNNNELDFRYTRLESPRFNPASCNSLMFVVTENSRLACRC
jgi:hypothetical protein